jgi:hypothetical protein
LWPTFLLYLSIFTSVTLLARHREGAFTIVVNLKISSDFFLRSCDESNDNFTEIILLFLRDFSSTKDAFTGLERSKRQQHITFVTPTNDHLPGPHLHQ